ncbi:MAG: hypothetical protein JST26_03860 [Bacteroidetes bacterium]|nr:hypothetical protein [Bacteroidota bacterium]
MQVNKINFKRERDFSAVFSDSLAFIKQNFKGLFGSILLIAGPFLLIAGLSIGYVQGLSSGGALTRSFISEGRLDLTSLYLSLGIGILFAFIANAVVVSTTYEYMLLYDAKLPGEKVLISEVGRKVFAGVWRIIGSILLLSVVFGIIGGVIALAAIGIGGGLGIFGGVLLVLLMVAFVLILGPVMIYYFPAGFFVTVRDKINIFSALGTVRQYMKGSFWWTWLIIVVAYICLLICRVVFSLPATIVSGVETFSRIRSFGMSEPSDSSILLTILYTISTVLSSTTSAIMLVICAFNFMGHEEKHEGTGLMSRIEEIK